jgi:HK97 family phage prohead protease
METEKRTFDPVDAQVRATRRGRMIEGYAIVFNKRSKDLGGFVEVIEPSAVDGVLERADVLALLDHNMDRGVLARSTNGEGTLELRKDDYGVKYNYEAPDTALGDEVLSGIRRGDIRTSSFAFSVDPVEDRKNWVKQEDGTYLRTIKKFKDISGSW